MSDSIKTSDSKRLAKNTAMLYVRTLVVMCVSFFTSRVILASLGVKDFGTYNVIGGFVSMFSLVSGTLVSATQRFLNVELGKKTDSNPNKVFCTAIGIHAGISAVLLLLFETVGLWFLNYKMNIPEGRMLAANVVFQCSMLAFIMNVMYMPFNAVIIAYERMKAFAYISLLDAILRLAIAYSLFLYGSDRLILYAVLHMLEVILLGLLYVIYCKRHFPDTTKIYLVKDKQAYIRQTSFAGYTFLGSVASILANQGVNVILNLFGGVTVNAARGLAVQVQNAVTKFVNDFMTALNPQITKTYAAGDIDKSMTLVYRGAKYSFFLILALATPIIFKAPYILELWLKNVPDYTVIFVRLTLAYSMVVVLSNTLITEILATGKIKINAFIIGGLRLTILPLCYLVLKMGSPIYSAYFVLIGIDFLSLFTRLYILKDVCGVAITGYVRHVLLYVILVSAPVMMANYYGIQIFSNSLFGLGIYAIISVFITGVFSFILGMTSKERNYFYVLIQNKILKK